MKLSDGTGKRIFTSDYAPSVDVHSRRPAYAFESGNPADPFRARRFVPDPSPPAVGVLPVRGRG